jgi:hypothetical protein
VREGRQVDSASGLVARRGGGRVVRWWRRLRSLEKGGDRRERSGVGPSTGP